MQVVRPRSHDETIERLWRAARNARLPHALLFEGRAGIGKYQAAKWFALGCLCASGPGVPCLTCGPCRRVLSGGARGNHADLLVIDPLLEGEERIRIGRIAQRAGEQGDSSELCLEVFLGLRPLEGRWRVVLVRESQRMNASAQNALLKTLEEPRPGTLLVLETHRPAALLSTLKSRCIRIRFASLTREACEVVLRENGLSPGEARDMARISEGSPGTAMALARSGAATILERLGEVAAGRRSPFLAAAELWELEGEFPGKSEGAMQRERCRVVLDLVAKLLGDAQRAALGISEDALALGTPAGALGARVSLTELMHRARVLAEIRVDVEHNLAPTSLLERALGVLALGPPAASRV